MREGNYIENRIVCKIHVYNKDLYKISYLPLKYNEDNNK